MKFFAVASTIDLDHDPKLKQVWDRAGVFCRSIGLPMSNTPHLSWHVAEGYEMDDLTAVLRSTTHRSGAIKAMGLGLGIFPSSQPVVYMPVIKSPAIDVMHRELWDVLRSISQTPSEFYAPERWVPHVTLIHGMRDSEPLDQAIQAVFLPDLAVELVLTDLAVIFKDEDDSGTLARFQFEGTQ